MKYIKTFEYIIRTKKYLKYIVTKNKDNDLIVYGINYSVSFSGKDKYCLDFLYEYYNGKILNINGLTDCNINIKHIEDSSLFQSTDLKKILKKLPELYNKINKK